MILSTIHRGLYRSFLALPAILALSSPLSYASFGDLSYRSALYEFEIGNYEDAYLQLLQDSAVDEVVKKPESQLLLGKIYLELGRSQEAEEQFESLLRKDNTEKTANKVFYPLARASYANGDCKRALEAVSRVKNLERESMNHSIFIKVSCLVANEEISTQDLMNAEQIIFDLASKYKKQDPVDIWIAYAYYNIASAAARIGNKPFADKLYNAALRFADFDNQEAKKLKEKIKVTKGTLGYSMNRYAYSLDSFSTLPLDSTWTDETLLGYGWSAFRNAKPGVAIEAWRQLVNLPYKSMSVYEGYISIPYALEKANAYSEALDAYEIAIGEYDQVLKQIDKLSKSLSTKDINKHAKQYYLSGSTAVDPIHPLLAVTYTQYEYRAIVEKLAAIEGFKHQLREQKNSLSAFQDYQKKYRVQAKKRAGFRSSTQKAYQANLANFERELDKYVSRLFKQKIIPDDVDASLVAKYEEYKRLTRFESGVSGNKRDQLKDKVGDLRLSIINALIQEYRKDPGELLLVKRLLDDYTFMEARYQSYQDATSVKRKATVASSDYKSLNSRIIKLERSANLVRSKLEKELLKKTRSALLAQRKRIDHFKTQARIASVNLKEEFYQMGGRRLW